MIEYRPNVHSDPRHLSIVLWIPDPDRCIVGRNIWKRD